MCYMQRNGRLVNLGYMIDRKTVQLVELHIKEKVSPIGSTTKTLTHVFQTKQKTFSQLQWEIKL